MADELDISSDSDTDDLDSCVWSLKKRNSLKKKCNVNEKNCDFKIKSCLAEDIVQDKYHKFEELQKKSNAIKAKVAKKCYKAEKNRSKKLVKRALKDPLVRDLLKKNSEHEIENECNKEKEEKEWKEVKPFLNINSHLQGPVSHGDWGPKTELETTIENAIKEGDFEKAELLSDTLSNREFAMKISKAYAAKRQHEELEKQKCMEKDKNSKKIRWTFEAKERWQMKGHM